MSVARITWLTILFAVCVAAQPRTARADPDEQGVQAAAARPCSGKATSSRNLENVPLEISPATDKDQTLVVRVVVEQPYIDNVATRVTYDGMDRVFGIEWQVGKTTHRLRVPESLVTEDAVAADILDCTDKGVSMPARYTSLTAPRLVPYFIAVRKKWSGEFDEMAAASSKMAAIALVLSLRTTAAPATAQVATTRLGAASKPRSSAAATATSKPSPSTATSKLSSTARTKSKPSSGHATPKVAEAGKNWCFPAETKVHTPNGLVDIEISMWAMKCSRMMWNVANSSSGRSRIRLRAGQIDSSRSG